MDKVKIKTAVTEVEEVVNELVTEGKLDGDQAKILIHRFAYETINREFQPVEVE